MEELKGRNNMGQINLYKIDISKGEDFFENLNKKFECIGTQEYQLLKLPTPHGVLNLEKSIL